MSLIVYMGVFKRDGSTAELWQRSEEFPYHCISRLMSCNRGEQIKRFFHIGGKESYHLPAERMFEKLETLASTIKAQSKATVTPGSHVSIDEMMI